MRKKILFFLAILGCFFISACGNEKSEEDTNKPDASVSPKTTIDNPEAPAPPPPASSPKAVAPENSGTVAPPPPSESDASTSPKATVSDPEAPAPPPAPIENESSDSQVLTDL